MVEILVLDYKTDKILARFPMTTPVAIIRDFRTKAKVKTKIKLLGFKAQ